MTTKTKAPGAASFLAKVCKDPKAPPQAVIVAGYVGESPFDGHYRIYFHPDLSDYIDVPQDDYLHYEAVPGDPLGAVYAWVRQGAAVVHKGSEPAAEAKEE